MAKGGESGDGAGEYLSLHWSEPGDYGHPRRQKSTKH